MTLNGETMHTGNGAAPHRTRWLRPEEVRTPVTVQEGEAALDVIDHHADHLEATIARRTAKGEECTGLTSLLKSWESRRAEVTYAIERLEAGEPAPSVELATARAKIAVLEGHVERLRAQIHVDVHSPSTRVADLAQQVEALKKQNADIIKKNAGLAEAITNLQAALAKAKSDSRYAAAVRGQHKQCAAVLEALDDLEGRGVVLPPMARLVRNTARTALPADYLATTWAIDGRPHLLNAAREIEARDGGAE